MTFIRQHQIATTMIVFSLFFATKNQAQTTSPKGFDFDNTSELKKTTNSNVSTAKTDTTNKEVKKNDAVIKDTEVTKEDSLFEENVKINLTLNEKRKYVFTREDGKEGVVVKEYDDAATFSGGLAKVAINNKWGFIDSSLKETIPLNYDFVWPFSNGVAMVQKNRKYGLINAAGVELAPIIYDTLDFFKKSFAKFLKNGEIGYLNREGKEFDEAIELEDAWYKIRKNGKWGFADNKGSIIVIPIYDDVKPFKDDFATVNKSGKWVFITRAGEQLPYDEIGPFIDGFASVRTRNRYAYVSKYFVEYDSVKPFSNQKAIVYKNGKYGIVGKNTIEVVPPQYDYIDNFSNSRAKIKKDGQYGYLDENGAVSVPPTYDEAFAYSNDIARVKKNKKYGFIETDGKLIGELEYADARDFKEGLALVKINQKYGYINTNGKVKIVPMYLDGRDYVEGFAQVKDTNNKWVYINKEGLQMPFDEIFPLTDSMALVRKIDKYGFIDAKGKVAIPGIYDEASNFRNGLAYVQILGKMPAPTRNFYITKRGDVLPYDNAHQFYNGFAKVEKNGKVGYINSQGKEIIAPIYDDGSNFNNGIAMAEKETVKGYLTQTGSFYDGVTNFVKNIAIIRKGNSFGTIDTNMAEIIPPTNDAIYFNENKTFLVVQNNGKSALHYFQGKQQGKSLGYDNVMPFSEGLAVVMKNNLYGFINNEGKEVLALEYDWADSFRNGKALVARKGKSFYIDPLGQLIK